jgi:creatinine amidohydrolase
VRPLTEAGPGSERRARIKALREGRAWAPRRWTAVSADTGIGNPASASAEKGARFLDAVARYIADFLAELDGVDTEDLYA